MRERHARALGVAQERLLRQDADIVAIIVGGSIAKGTDRDESDVDLIVVVTDEEYASRLATDRAFFLWTDVCDYDGGLVEGRFVSRSFMQAACDRGSEPTRHSFIGAFPVYCADPAVADLIPKIPVYPEHERSAKIGSFLAQIDLYRGYFWHVAKRDSDRYLLVSCATELVHFGARLILAHNRQLYATRRRLMEQVAAAPEKPAGIEAKIDNLLTDTRDETKEEFCKAVLEFTDWGEHHLDSRFVVDVELSWFNRVHDVAEW